MSHHTGESMKGKVKETVGDVTGNKSLELEGKLDQASASAKEQIDKVTDKVTNKDKKVETPKR